MLSSQDRDIYFIASYEAILQSLREEIIPKNFWAGRGLPQQLSTAKQVEQHGLVPQLHDKGVWPTGNTTKFAKIFPDQLVFTQPDRALHSRAQHPQIASPITEDDSCHQS